MKQLYNLIELISQKNSGAAAARKAGMAQCVNDYVINLDCDDQISAYSVEAVIDRLNKSQPDIVLFELDCEVLGKDGLYIQRFNMFNVKYIRGITSNFERYTQAVFYIQQIKY